MTKSCITLKVAFLQIKNNRLQTLRNGNSKQKAFNERFIRTLINIPDLVIIKLEKRIIQDFQRKQYIMFQVSINSTTCIKCLQVIRYIAKENYSVTFPVHIKYFVHTLLIILRFIGLIFLCCRVHNFDVQLMSLNSFLKYNRLSTTSRRLYCPKFDIFTIPFIIKD